MRGVARQGDKVVGICRCHKKPIKTIGEIITSSNDVLTDGRGTARQGDMVRARCGHTGTIITGSSSSFIDGRGTARMGDQVKGCFSGQIITYSNTRSAG